MQGLASSHTVLMHQARIDLLNSNFQLGKIHLSGSPSPTDEWTLCWFSTSLANAVRQTTMCFKRHWQIIGGRSLICVCQPEIVSCWPFLIPLIYHFWTFYFSFVNQTLTCITFVRIQLLFCREKRQLGNRLLKAPFLLSKVLTVTVIGQKFKNLLCCLKTDESKLCHQGLSGK